MGIREASAAVRAVDARYQMRPVPFAAALGVLNAVMWWFISREWLAAREGALVAVTVGLVWFVLWAWAVPRYSRGFPRP